MNYIEAAVELLELIAAPAEKDKEVREIFKGERRRILLISLRNGAVLTRHKAPEPITVQCISGSGTFTAGPDLEDSQKLVPGTFLTLDPDIEHEATAESELHILVTRFIGDAVNG